MKLKQTNWFRKLKEPEQKDVAQVVRTLHDWTNVKLAKPNRFNSTNDIEYAKNYALENFYFFSLYATGSIITSKQNPNDIDLLLVTNLFPNEVWSVEPKFKDLIAKLEETHNVEIDSEITNKYSDFGTEARLKLDIERKDEKCKPIDIVYQWDILSPKHWEKHDKVDAKKIFDVGAKNPQGYDGRLNIGAKNIPLNLLRISQALREGYR